MADYRRPMAWTLSLLVLCVTLTACGPNERETRRPAAVPVPSANRDAVLNERLSRIQNQITDLDHKISEAAVGSRKLNEELTALRQELANGFQAQPVAPGAPPAAAAAPSAAIQPAPIASQSPAPAPGGASPLVWIVILVILAFAVVFIVKHFMGMWADEEDEDWIDEESGAYEGDDEKIQLSPEMGEAPPVTEDRKPDDDAPKP